MLLLLYFNFNKNHTNKTKQKTCTCLKDERKKVSMCKIWKKKYVAIAYNFDALCNYIMY